MVVTATDFKNNSGSYLKLSNEEDIIVTKKGRPIARLIGNNRKKKYIADELVGLLSNNYDLDESREERLNKQ